MPTNLLGANVNAFFSTAGTHADGNAPYTNTGGANAAATLTLNATAANVIVTEAAGAFSGAGNAITVDLNGPGQFIFQGANGYTGDTNLGSGAALSIGDAGALGAGALTLGANSVLESTVTGTLRIGITATASGSETIEAAAGTTLTLVNQFGGTTYTLGGSGSVLTFGSSTDTGTVELGPSNISSSADTRGAVAIAGGTLLLDTPYLGVLRGGFTVGTGATAATLDINNFSLDLFDLGGDASGVITNNGSAAATVRDLGGVSSTFAGVLEDGSAAVSLRVSTTSGAKFTLTNANSFSGGTQIDGGALLSISNIGALGSGGVTFQNSGVSTLESTVSGTLTNAFNILAGATAKIEAAAGQTLTLAGASFYANGGSGDAVHFGSATDTGTVVLDTQALDSYTGAGGVSIDGGKLSIGSAVAADLIGNLGGVTLAASGTALEATVSATLATPITLAAGVTATLEAAAGATLTLNNSTMNFLGQGAATLDIGSSSDTGTVAISLAGFTGAASQDTISINGGKLSVTGIAGSQLLRLNGLTFAGNNTVLESDGASLNSPLTIASGVSATIEAVSGSVLDLRSVGFQELGGAGSTLHFGSASDTGYISADWTGVSSVDQSGAVSIDGGTLEMGMSNDPVLDNLRGGLTVGSGATIATLELSGHSNTFYNLSGNASGVISNFIAPATLTVISTLNTTYNGAIDDRSGALLSLHKAGNGTLKLTGQNQFSGGTSIDSGTLEIGAVLSSGAGAITFASNAYATLRIDPNFNIQSSINLVDGTSAIDFAGLAFDESDKLSLLNGTTWQLKNAANAQLELFKLNGAFSATNLLVGSDGSGGTQIAAAYTAVAAAGRLRAIAGSPTPIFIRDSALSIAANLTAINTLIAEARVASIFANDASFTDGDASTTLAVIGEDDTITLGVTGASVSLYGTYGGTDTVNGSNGTIYLADGQGALVVGAGDTISFGAGTSNVATLKWAGGVASYSIAGFTAADTINLSGLTSSYSPTTTGGVAPSAFSLAINGNVVTQTNSDGSKLVSRFNVTGQTYTTIVRSFDAAGDLTAVEHEGITGAPYIADTTLYSGPGTTGNIVSGNDLFYTGQASGLAEVDLDGSNNLLRALYAYPTTAPGTQTGFEADYVAGQLAGGVATYLSLAGAPYSTFAVEYDNNYQYIGAVYTFNYTGQTYDEAQYSYSAGAQPKLTEASFSGYTGSGGPSVASFFYNNAGASTGVQYSYTGITGQAYTSDTLLYNAANVLMAAEDSGYTTKAFSSQTTFYNASGVAQEIVRDFTSPTLAGVINGQAYNAFERIFNPAFTLLATAYHLDNGGNVYVGLASGVSSPTFGGTGVNVNTAELSNTLTGGDWTITGGGTGETFNFASFFNQAEITDYGAAFGGATDVISVSTQDFADWTTMLADAAPSGGGANTTFTSTTTGDKLTLDGVTLAQLQGLTPGQAGADFLFHS